MKMSDVPDTNVGKINGKTPNEIMADAATCLTRPPGSQCNRFALYAECKGDCRYIIKNLYDLVMYYEARLVEAEKELDAAANDLSQEGCRYCKHVKCSLDEEPCKGCRQLNYPDYFKRISFEWRGVCPENTRES